MPVITLDIVPFIVIVLMDLTPEGPMTPYSLKYDGLREALVGSSVVSDFIPVAQLREREREKRGHVEPF